MKIVLDLTHSSHCPALTGVQRVCRELVKELGPMSATPEVVIHDRYANRWRQPDRRECALLKSKTFGQTSGSNWSLGQRLRGRWGLIREPDWAALRGSALLVPEIFSADTFPAYRRLRIKLRGAAGAVFHDAVALRLPQYSPAKTIARFPNYLHELATFDGIAANSEASRDELIEYWKREKLRSPPPVVAIPLGVEAPVVPPRPPAAADPKRGPLILSVGTLEGRKNHLSLIEAAETLWGEGCRFRLVLAGLHLRETGQAAVNRARELQARGRPLELPGAVSEARLHELYAACHFTVYPSFYEGYGLPVAESLLRHRPCICGPGGALAETARGGGCLLLPEATPAQLADAMRTLLTDAACQRRLVEEAAQRRFPTWADYARKISDWLADLQPRPSSRPAHCEKILEEADRAEEGHMVRAPVPSYFYPLFRKQNRVNQALIAALRDTAESLAETSDRLERLEKQNHEQNDKSSST